VTPTKHRKFDRILLDVVDQGLKDVLGEPAVRFIYDYLETNSSLKREDIPKKPETFVEGLEEMLSSGAKVIEKLILKNLCSHLEVEYRERTGYGFSEYIREIEAKFSRPHSKGM